MLALVQSAGSVPESIDLWNIHVTAGESSAAHSLSTMFGILSGPLALLTLILESNLVTPGVKMVIWVRGVDINFLTFGITPSLIFVKTELYWPSKISALVLLSLSNCPLLRSGEMPTLSCFLLFT